MQAQPLEDVFETELLIKLKQGDQYAFEQLYFLHSKLLYNNILHLVKEREVAEELLQDLYLKIWENRINLDPGKSFKAYLFTIARNMVYDYFRKVSLNKRMIVKMMINVKESYSNIEDIISFKESSASLKDAIDTLPAQSKKVYILSKLEGKSHEEISIDLGISVSTVNNHIVKANRIVRSYLAKHSDLAVALLVYSFIEGIR